MAYASSTSNGSNFKPNSRQYEMWLLVALHVICEQYPLWKRRGWSYAMELYSIGIWIRAKNYFFKNSRWAITKLMIQCIILPYYVAKWCGNDQVCCTLHTVLQYVPNTARYLLYFVVFHSIVLYVSSGTVFQTPLSSLHGMVFHCILHVT